MNRLRGDDELAAELEKLTLRSGVRRVSANAASASIVIEYDARRLTQRDVIVAGLTSFGPLFPDLDVETLSKQIGGHLNGNSSNGNHHGREPLSAQIRAWFSAVDETVEGTVAPLTPGAGLRTLVPVGLAILGLARLMSSEKLALPTWYELLWFSFGLFTVLNAQAPSEGQSRRAALAAP